ncbi:acyl carrier protein [Morchella conica CCBAS932]|uniref:Acyl carrier protein n=1 Tax=Morchella conica CCBAS932 TaxID=1392247 RepID=A0A3N4L4J5_9PEZI|nr:acyl carrier protein [Morchella conica CCBAS932]
MFRTAAIRASRSFSTAALGARVSAPIAVVARPTCVRAVLPAMPFAAIRSYSAPAKLSKDEVEGRIIELLKGFDKVTTDTKVTGTSHFTNDLGLDSLDTVEVVMAIEEEFSIEIPDKEADAIQSVEHAVNYIVSQPDAN